MFRFYTCNGPGLVIIFGNAIDTDIISSAFVFYKLDLVVFNTDPLMIFEYLRFIRNLSHGVCVFVTFIKTYLEYNQMQLQTDEPM